MKKEKTQEIIVGENAGFCYGVKRAVEGALIALEKNKNIYCLGELVHNKDVVEELKNKGITFVENPEEVKKITIIRAHGISKEVYEKLKNNKIEIIDYTCPNVSQIHQIAEAYSNKGYYIFLLGDKSHPENIGTKSYCGENYSVIENESEIDENIEKYELTGIKKLVIISQTTFDLLSFNNITRTIKERLKQNVELVIKNTICAATQIRQLETEKISKKVEFMIIIGGKNSSNTKKLYNIAKENCLNTICIENAKEINKEETQKYNKIGIMAGASTPQKTITEVEEEIKK